MDHFSLLVDIGLSAALFAAFFSLFGKRIFADFFSLLEEREARLDGDLALTSEKAERCERIEGELEALLLEARREGMALKEAELAEAKARAAGLLERASAEASEQLARARAELAELESAAEAQLAACAGELGGELLRCCMPSASATSS